MNKYKNFFKFYHLTNNYKFENIITDINLLTNYVYTTAFNNVRNKYNIELKDYTFDDEEIYLNPYLQIIFIYTEIIKIIKKISVSNLTISSNKSINTIYRSKVIHPNELYYSEFINSFKFVYLFNGNVHFYTKDEEGNKIENKLINSDTFDYLALQDIKREMEIPTIKHIVEFHMFPEHHLYQKYLHETKKMFVNLQKIQYKLTQKIVNMFYDMIKYLLIKKRNFKSDENTYLITGLKPMNSLIQINSNEKGNKFVFLTPDGLKIRFAINSEMYKMKNLDFITDETTKFFKSINLKKILDTATHEYGKILNFNAMAFYYHKSYDYDTEWYDFIYNYELYFQK